MYKAPFRRDFSLGTDVLRIYSPTHCQTCHFAGLNEKTHILQKESIGLTPTILLVKNHASFLPPGGHSSLEKEKMELQFIFPIFTEMIFKVYT